ncbi:hypothetical protein SmJEL517_g02747 [Synchytrium microbalum]|uniref:Sister chromatid cohesion protein DCC1 n=1 Tax=Synchytrium microbalum TaxID=1806994 RepID=A0A507C0R8_9FUNG|nr:uncharacterized protein SmJEL517_g02747 [Synchytrium microbalum]TPX34687.1 hypothetical protein SmJEL517_g02747 [Synchytrium microbalum]
MTGHGQMNLLYFASDFEARRYRLVELPKEMADLFASTSSSPPGAANETSLLIKGHPHDEAVLCTATSTHSLKDVQVSNTLLIARPSPAIPTHMTASSFGEHLDGIEEEDCLVYEVQDSLNSYYELAQVLPRLDRLRDMLIPSAFRGPEDEENDAGTLFIKKQIMETIQASHSEIERGLKDLHATEINGYCRMIDPEYTERILSLILNTVVSENLDLSCVPLQTCTKELAEDDVPDYMLAHILDSFSSSVDVALQRYTLSKDKISTFFGIQLLASAHPKQWQLEDFMEAWKERVLDLTDVSLDLLRGSFLKETTPLGVVYLKYYPKHVVSSMDAKSRFEYLFSTRARWTLDEIIPYIEDLAADKKKLDVLLLKFARASGSGINTTYSSRFATVGK